MANSDTMSWSGTSAVQLTAGDCEVIVIPNLGMLIPSICWQGNEIVALPGGLDAYRAGHTTGIPFLHPWANRLSGMEYSVQGTDVGLKVAHLHLDDQGLPMHGTMTAQADWTVTYLEADESSARCVAIFAFGDHPELLASFPFPHEIEMSVTVTTTTVLVTTTVRPTGSRAVPISFGYHPYLVLPGAARRDWVLSLPACERMALDDCGIPTGTTQQETAAIQPLAERALDDLFALGDSREFAIANDAMRIALNFDEGYPFAQVYSPTDSEFCCIEPMTAPTNALVSGTHPTVQPGTSFEAAFTISISAA